MARRPALTKRKPKTIRTTKSETYLVNKKHLGDEPLMVGEVNVTVCLNWYNYMCNSSDARDYIKDYLKNTGRVADAKKLSKVSDSELPLTAAWLCRMISRGYKPPGTTMQFVSANLSKLLEKAEINNTEEPETSKQVISIQDRMRERTHDILGEIEGLIDDFIYKNEEFSLYTWLQSNNIPAAYATNIIAKLSPVLDELLEAYDGSDPQLKEGYRSFKKSEIKRIIDFYNTMCDDAAKYANVTKKTRAPRKPRVQSLEKKLKSFKFQKEDNTFKIASINPEKIIGAQELWAFNTKYKTLSVFRALDRGGLDVKGTSIIKYNEETSITMRTGYKPAEAIKKVIEGGKLILRKIDQEFKNHAPLQARINENTILLRVVT